MDIREIAREALIEYFRPFRYWWFWAIGLVGAVAWMLIEHYE